MSPFPRLAAACLGAVLAVTVAPAPAGWADSTHHKLKKAQHQAHRLDAEAQRRADQVAGARRRLAGLDARANAALDRFQTAKLAADRAQAESEAAQEKLAVAQARTTAARNTLNEMAANAYRTMASGGGLGTTMALVENGDPQQFVNGLAVLGQIGKSEAAVVDELRLAEADEIRTQHLAMDAAARATSAADAARLVKERADRLVAAQQREVRRQHALLAQTRQAADEAHALTKHLQHRIAVARAKALAIQARQAAQAAGGVLAKCDGGSVAGYPNGQLPVKSLCPLWGAPSEMLRADAAAGFNRMSRAYAAVFHTPLCVTASYRTYQRQVELYATMPAGYAAVPGTSNHGWALALDLCGGIQVDGSPEHAWLLDHAAAYSWFHPSWAMPGGGGPHEPWHWEYAG